MKKFFMYLTLACYVLTSNAMTFSGHEKDKKEKSENSVQQKKNFYLFLPLGIEELNLVGARTKGRCDKVFFFPANKDATRFLEKAVQENDVEKAEKLLKAGASAYVSYDMIKNKQYEMIDAMHKDNPKLIRYSQMLHYACATSDTTMIDFLIDRNASLDLCGYCEAKGGRGYWGDDSERSKWNGDNRFANTPADVALMYSQWTNLYYIINKYHKYPTINGCTRFFTLILKYNPNLVDLLKKFLSGEDEFRFLKDVDYTMADILNFGHHQYEKVGDHMEPKGYFPINEVVSKIAGARHADSAGGQEYIDLMKMMIDKGADVNLEEDNGAFYRHVQSIGINVGGYINTCPMYIALQTKNMMDIIKYLREKGANMTITANGRKVSLLNAPGVLDEYKEYFMLEGL